MNTSTRRLLTPLAAGLLTTVLSAQAVTVDYPDSALVSPPQLLFPTYTPGGGGSVRYQTMCPGSFAGLPKTAMVATRVGIQIAGRERYARFEIRFGPTKLTSLQNCFKANLADERIQHDFSGQVLPGGVQNNTPVNEWVEFDLDHPFAYTPGDGLVLDIVSSAAVANRWCLTGTGGHGRMYAAPYDGSQTCGSVTGASGLKFRVVFQPIGFPVYGQGCKGQGSYAPSIAGLGSTQTGRVATITMTNGLGGAPTLLMIGASRTNSSFGKLPLDLGASCAMSTSLDILLPTTASGTGAGMGTASGVLPIPNNAQLIGASAFAQWLQFDAASRAVLPLTTSNGLILLVR